MARDGESMRPRWAPRVNRSGISRLYKADALGLRDEELADEVGIALYARCLSMIEATEASEGNARCPSCQAAVVHDGQDETILKCVNCGWHLKWLDFRKSFRNKKLAAPGILGPLRDFAREYPKCRSYSAKVIAIDALIHTFHAQSRKWPTSPIAKNMLDGNVREIVAFLDNLAYGSETTPELVATREAYKTTLARSWAGGAKRPADWREPHGAGNAQQ